MTKRSNNAWLRRFIKETKLTRPQIATAVCVNVSTVDRWLVAPRKASHRKMPDMAVRLLTYMDDAGDLNEEG